MTTIVIEDELYVTLEEAASCYSLTIEELVEAGDLGVLGRTRTYETHVVIRIEMLDRVATLRRLTRHLDLDFTAAILQLLR
ncbi:MAG: hypothetical protein KDC95_15105 [Planctomycetes bacterium]|nr:hypothetical protein [Planctomycetota bacterium]